MTISILLSLVFAHCIILHLSTFNLCGIMFRCVAWKQYIIGECTCFKINLRLMSLVCVCFLSLLMSLFPPFYFVLYDYNISLIFFVLSLSCVFALCVWLCLLDSLSILYLCVPFHILFHSTSCTLLYLLRRYHSFFVGILDLKSLNLINICALFMKKQ